MPKKTLRQATMPERDDDAQSRAFIDKAREIGADGKRSAADKLMERLVKMKPEPRKKQGG